MEQVTWKSNLSKLVRGEHLTAEETEWFVDDLMRGNADPAAVGAVLATQQQLGLTQEEVAGAAKAMVAHAVPLDVQAECTDIVGTGGDGMHTVNLSTMGAVIAAAAGVTIVKHGNRAASSKCGAADCLEALGLPLDLVPQAVAAVADEVGITFAFLGVNILAAIAVIGVTTFVLSLAGVVVGNAFGSRFEKPATIAGGIVLILIGLKILLEHLGVLG